MNPLLANERVLISTRQHWTVFLPHAVLTVVLAIVLAVVVAILPGKVAGHSTGEVRGIAEALIVVVALLWVGVALLRYRAAVDTLTDHRIIESRGVASKTTESITLDRIQDVRVRQSVFDRMVGRGNIEIESAGRDGIEVLGKIPSPQTFYKDLMQAMDARNHPVIQVVAPPGSTAQEMPAQLPNQGAP